MFFKTEDRIAELKEKKGDILGDKGRGQMRNALSKNLVVLVKQVMGGICRVCPANQLEMVSVEKELNIQNREDLCRSGVTMGETD